MLRSLFSKVMQSIFTLGPLGFKRFPYSGNRPRSYKRNVIFKNKRRNFDERILSDYFPKFNPQYFVHNPQVAAVVPPPAKEIIEEQRRPVAKSFVAEIGYQEMELLSSKRVKDLIDGGIKLY